MNLEIKFFFTRMFRRVKSNEENISFFYLICNKNICLEQNCKNEKMYSSQRFGFAASSIRGRVRRGREPYRVPMVLLALKRPAFKVARKGEECMYEIYTTRPHLQILIVEGLCPRARSTPRAVKEEKRDTISFRPAGRPTEPVSLS
jgi:hypothetical protein